jgi:Protein of unknown function (DUF3761)
MRRRIGVVLVLSACALLSGGQAATAQCARGQSTTACVAEQEYAVGLLRGVVVAHRGSTYKRPGYSSLKVVSTPEAAYITASEPRTGIHKRWLTAERENNIVRVGWSCKQPEQTFHYALTARGEAGVTVTAQVTFHAQLTRRWCATAKREEAQLAAKRRHEAEIEKARKHVEELERATKGGGETNCSNGTYINSSGETVCKPQPPMEGGGPPPGATAKCVDGEYSSSKHRRGTCSGHGGVAEFLVALPA